MLIILVWTAIIVGSWGWAYYQVQIGGRQSARQEALSAFQKDLVYRLWNTGHGGVYVPITPQTQPNPYLRVPERDIETLSGQLMTLINPSYMTRQVHELGLEKYGTRSHITSLKPIRPKNAPDPWEKQALQSFEQGSKEAIAIASFEDGPYLRFMRPLVTAEKCLKCHAKQGYKSGDIRGGISVSVPMAPYLAQVHRYVMVLTIGHILIWCIGLIGIIQGAKRFEKYEEKVIKNKNRLEAIFSSIQSGVLVIDSESHVILEANPAACNLIGLSKDEIVGQVCHRFICPAQKGACPITDLGKTADNAERELIKFDRTRAYVLKTVVPIMIDDRPCLLESFVDITDRKRMELEMKNLLANLERQNLQLQKNEEALQTSEKKFRSMFDSFQDLYFRSNMKGIIELISPSVKPLAGYEVDELIGKSVLEIFVAVADRDELMAALLSAEKVSGHELKLKKQSGETAIISLNAQIVSDDSGNPIAIEGVIRDITGKIKAEEVLKERVDELDKTRYAMLNMIEDLEKARKDAEEATQAKSNFLANMSHEIRTPMNSILGFLELVLEDPSLTELQREHLTTAQISANGLLGLINDILDISKLESGKLTIEQRPFSVLRLMQEIHETMDIKAKEKGLAFKLDIPPSISGSFVGDPLRLRQITINLVGNAVKFTENGSVSLHIMPAEEEGQLHFVIEDTGIGIPADRLGQIFESFTQADTSTTRRFGGTGLGTTISRELVELMGGRIWADSEEGKGSTFHFTINLTPSDLVPEETDLFIVPGKTVLPGVRRGLRILLAEDVQANVDLAKIRLQQQSHDVTVAWNGREAVEAFQRGKIDVILMDVQMPEMSGIEATKRIRALEVGTGGHVPIIAITAGVMREETEKYLEVGMDAVVAKPIDFGKLFKTMESVVPEGAGQEVFEEGVDVSDSSKLELPPLDGVDIKKGIQTWQNPEAYAKALLGFSRDYGNAADELSSLIDQGDMDGAFRIAHALKGVVGNLSVTEVAEAAIHIDAALREKRLDDAKNQISTLAAALTTATDAIRQLEAVQDVEEMPKKEMDMPHLTELFIKMLAAFDQFSPYAIQPFLSELKEYLSQDQLSPIVAHVERFDFDGAIQETAKLAETLRIDLEG